MWPHLFSRTLKTCTHFLTVPAEWGISPLWSLGGIKPSCNTPQGHSTSSIPSQHTSSPYCHTTHSTFSNFRNTKTSFYFLFFDLEGRTPPRWQDKGRTPKSFLAKRARKTSSKLWKCKVAAVGWPTHMVYRIMFNLWDTWWDKTS